MAALPPPGFETLSMVDLLRYQADHLDFGCVSTTVYLDLVLLRICHCVSVIWCFCVSAAVYLPLWIGCCLSVTVYLPLYLLPCICHCVCCVVYLPLFLPLYIYRCVSARVSAPVNVYFDPVLYIRHCTRRCVSATVYISTTVYPPLYICHCVCCIVESDRVQREIELIVYQTI